METDDLVTRESGEWVKRKHHYLRRYCDMFTVSMQRKWSRLTYLDMLAGPGRCKIRETGEIIPGSPLVSLEYSFNEYRFYEEDAACADALSQRVSSHPKANQCQVIHADWTEVVLSSTFRLPSGLILAFIDPTGISQIPWQAIQKLGTSSNSIDILMTIQHGMGIKLNTKQYLTSKRDQTAVDAFLGGSEWRSKLPGATDFCGAVLDQFTENMAGLGFKTRKWILVKNDTGMPLYYLCLFSRHERALKFWDEVGKKDEAGQRAWDF